MVKNTEARNEMTKCERPDHSNRPDVWRYRINIFGTGVVTAFACQECVKDVRRVHGQNIQSVTKIG